MMKLATLCAVGALALGAGAARADIYSNDFSANSNGFTGVTNIDTAPSGQKFLAPLYNGATASLSLNTSGYTSLTLSFDLYAIGSVDGDGQFGGAPDPFIVAVTNGATLMNNNFANYNGNTQNYPVEPSAADSGATATGSLGYSGFPGTIQDAIYHFSFTAITPTAGGTTVFNFAGDTNEGLDNEFYGIDNVMVTGVARETTGGGVPEPATWAMMLTGFGGLGAALRRRRRANAAAFAA